MATKKLTVGQKVKIGASIGFAVFVVALEKRRVDALLAAAQLSWEEICQNSWQQGVDYGIQISKSFLADPEKAGELVVAAFDKN